MPQNSSTYALIPARSGSKRIRDKNIRILGGYPLLAWSIAAAKMCNLIDKVVVSTDSERYALIAKDYDAQVSIRPSELCTDDAGDAGYLKHFADNYRCSYIVLLRPTTPLRDPREIEKAIMYYRASKEWDVLRSMHKTSEPVYKCYRKEDVYAIPIHKSYSPDSPSQLLPDTYHPDGYVDIYRPDMIGAVGRRIWETVFVGELDTEEDWDYIEWRLQKYGSKLYEYLRNFK